MFGFLSPRLWKTAERPPHTHREFVVRIVFFSVLLGVSAVIVMGAVVLASLGVVSFSLSDIVSILFIPWMLFLLRSVVRLRRRMRKIVFL